MPAAALADGAYVVRAEQTVGPRTGRSSANRFSIDTAPPATLIESGPNGISDTGEASVAFSSPEPGVRFECRLDGGAFAPCASPVRYTGLGVGAHEVVVRAIDRAGNIGPEAAHRWEIVAPPPPAVATTLEPPLVGIAAAPRARIAVAAQRVPDILRRGLPFSLSSLAPGRHVVSLLATRASLGLRTRGAPTVQLARATVIFSRAYARRVTLRPTASARTTLRRLKRSLWATIEVRSVPLGKTGPARLTRARVRLTVPPPPRRRTPAPVTAPRSADPAR
jgi:hypothetical protein